MKLVLRVSKKDVMLTTAIFVLLIPTLRPSAKAVPSIVNQLYSLLEITAFGVMILLLLRYIFERRNRRDWFVVFPLVLYIGAILLATFINNGDFGDYLYVSLKRIIPLIYICFELQIHSKHARRALFLLSGIMASANLLTMVIFPEGMYLTELTLNRAFLLGHKNSVTYYALLFFCSSISVAAYTGWKNAWYIFFSAFIMLMTAILSASSTGIVIATVAMFALLAYWFEFRFLQFDVCIPVYIILGLNIGIVFGGIQSRFGYIIEVLLGKSLDFTSRTMIWRRAINEIMNNIIFGLGYESSEIVRQKLILDSTHNTILSCLYMAGLFGLIMYSLYILHIAKQINHSIYTGTGKFFCCVLCAVLLAQVMEALDTNACVNLILIICAYGGIQNEYKKNAKRHRKILIKCD